MYTRIAAAVLAALLLPACSDSSGGPSQPESSLLPDAPSLAVIDGSGGCTAVKGAVSGRFDLNNGYWTEEGAIAFGAGEPEHFTSIDVNTGIKPSNPRLTKVTEDMTLDFSGTDQLLIHINAVGVPEPEPGLNQYHGSGEIAGGTGRFANASGHVTAQGLYVLPPAATPDNLGFLYIGRLSGSVCP